MRDTYKILFMAGKPVALTPGRAQSSRLDMPAVDVRRLRWLVLVPVLCIALTIAGALTASLYLQAGEDLTADVRLLHTSAAEIYRLRMDKLVRMLADAGKSVSRNPMLRVALQQRNSALLSKYAVPLFDTLKTEHGIDMMDVIAANKTVLFRADDPAHFGDVSDRMTLLAAQRSGSPVQAIEIGADGGFQLRSVNPVYGEKGRDQAIGYVVAGIKLGYVLAEMEKSLGIRVFSFPAKRFIQRESWQGSLPGTVDPDEWDRYGDLVPDARARASLSPAIAASISENLPSSAGGILDISQGHSYFRAMAVPVLDMEQRNTGSMVMLVDVTGRVLHAHNMIYLGLALAIGGCALLLAIFWIWTGRLGQLMELHRSALQDLSTRDALTGLINHPTFFTLLEDEIARSHRSGTPVSLLVLDVDQSRDDIGSSQTLEEILNREFGKAIHRQSRSTDKVCRYEDHKLAVILTETGAPQALIAAERTRASIRNYLSESGHQHSDAIVISIGAATSPGDAVSAQELVDAAERAAQIDRERGRAHPLRDNA